MDFNDSQVDAESASWTASDMYNRLWNAQVKTFDAAWQALSAGRTAAELDVADAVLESTTSPLEHQPAHL